MGLRCGDQYRIHIAPDIAPSGAQTAGEQEADDPAVTLSRKREGLDE